MGDIHRHLCYHIHSSWDGTHVDTSHGSDPSLTTDSHEPAVALSSLRSSVRHNSASNRVRGRRTYCCRRRRRARRPHTGHHHVRDRHPSGSPRHRPPPDAPPQVGGWPRQDERCRARPHRLLCLARGCGPLWISIVAGLLATQALTRLPS